MYYEGEGGKRQPDPATEEIIQTCRAGKQIASRAISETEIIRRALLAMVNEAALVLHEGVASRASDIDVAIVNGYGFPKWEGGPLFWARERGADALRRDFGRLAELRGPGFVQGDAGIEPIVTPSPSAVMHSSATLRTGVLERA